MKTAVEWLVEQLIPKAFAIYDITTCNAIEQAKQMEKDRSKIDFKIGYNQGYLDAQCNHINDADNFANEQDYLNESELPKEDKTFKQKSKWTKL